MSALNKLFGTQKEIEEEKTLEAIVSIESLKDKRIADLIAFGKTFYSNRMHIGLILLTYVGIPDALRQALKYAGKDGFVASLPELIAAKCIVEKDHDFWKTWYHTTHTEEDIGIDKKGLWVKRGKPVVAVVHGGGILTPNRIFKAHKEGLIDGAAKYSDKEFGNLLEGKLPNRGKIKFYTIEDLKRGVNVLEHNFGVVMPYELAQATKSGHHTKKEFMENPLVIARIVDLENLEKYFNKAKDTGEIVDNEHYFKNRNAYQAQGRLPFLFGGPSNTYSICNNGCFVAVNSGGAPKQ